MGECLRFHFSMEPIAKLENQKHILYSAHEPAFPFVPLYP